MEGVAFGEHVFVETTVETYTTFPRPTGYLDEEEMPKIEQAKIPKEVLERLVFKMGLTITVECRGNRLLMFITDRPKFGRIEAKISTERSRFYIESAMAIKLLDHIVTSVKLPQMISVHFNTNEYWRNVAVDILATLLLFLHDQDLFIECPKRSVAIESFWMRRMYIFDAQYAREHQDSATNLPCPVQTKIKSFSNKTVSLGGGDEPTTQLKIFGESEFAWPLKEPFFKTRLPNFGKGKHDSLGKFKFFTELCRRLDGKMQLQSIEGDLVDERGDYIAKRGLIFILSISGWDWLLNERFNYTTDQTNSAFVVAGIEHKLPVLLFATLAKRLKVPMNLVLLCLRSKEELRTGAIEKVANAAKLVRHWEFKAEGLPSWTFPEFEEQLNKYWKENNNLAVSNLDVPKVAAVGETSSIVPRKDTCLQKKQVKSDDEKDPLWTPRAAAGSDEFALNREDRSGTRGRTSRRCTTVKHRRLNNEEEEGDNGKDEEEGDNLEDTEETAGNLLSFESGDATKMLVTHWTHTDICTEVVHQNLRHFFSALLRDNQLTVEVKEKFAGCVLSEEVNASIVSGRNRLLTVSYLRNAKKPVDLLTDALKQFVTIFKEKELFSSSDEQALLNIKVKFSGDSTRIAVDALIQELMNKETMAADERRVKREEEKMKNDAPV